MFTFSKATKGFTLIETLIAISILLIAVAGPMVVVSQALTSSFYARDQITAFYLAQDAIEYLRNVKDVNVASGNSPFPNTDYAPCADLNRGCTIDTINQNVGTDTRQLHFFPNTGSYSYESSGGEKSRFSRIVKITQQSVESGNNNDSAKKEYKIDVTVKWNATALQGSERSITLTEYLYEVTNF